MRTTLTLDDDVAAKLQTEARTSGRSFRDVVNDMLRRGLASRIQARARQPFTVVARDLGSLQPGVALDNVSALIDQVEGSAHR